jgi:exosome complex exonuclease DIS3/RRP44
MDNLLMDNLNKMGEIIGILDIMSLVKYGIKNNVFLYLFKPTDRNLPNYYVPFNLKTKTNKMYKDKGKNIYTLITFNKIENDKHIGQIHSIIGTVGEIDIEYEFIQYKHGLHFKKNKLKIMDKFKENLIINNNNNYNIISIDPKDCQDIDDAIHFFKHDNNTIELGIHIADVSYYVEEGSDIDIEARKRLTTIYMPNKRIDMLPEELSTHICSLKENENRRVVSLVVTFDISFNIINTCIQRNIICSKKAYDYDNVDKLIKDNINENNIMDLYSVADKLLDKYKFNVVSEYSHKMIEVFMIFANMMIAKQLITFNSFLLRKHINNNLNLNLNNDIEDPTLKKHLHLINMKRAEYCNEILPHDGLNVPYYTHFTSPIRRYADIIVHRMLFNQNNLNLNVIDVIDVIDDLNNVNHKIKKMERDINKIDLVNIINKNKDKNNRVEAYITKIEDVYITIYIPKYNISSQFRLFDKKLDNIIKYKNKNKNTKIIIEYDNNIYELNYLDKIKVELVAYMDNENFNKKLICRIIEPFINL